MKNIIIATLQKNKIITPIIALGVIVIAIATLTNSIDAIMSFVEKRILKTTNENTTEIENRANIPVVVPENNIVETDKVQNTISLSPLEIIEKFNEHPPLQREDAKNHYIGLWVKWKLSLGAIRKDDNDIIRLILYGEYFSIGSGMNVPVSISCSVPLSENKQLALLEEGAPVQVSGRISNISGRTTIELDNVKLEIK